MHAKKKKTTAISNRPLSLAPFGTLYWVGESNSYCKIENLEY